MVSGTLQVYWKGFCQDIGVSRPTERTEPEEKIFPTTMIYEQTAAGNAKKQSPKLDLLYSLYSFVISWVGKKYTTPIIFLPFHQF